MKKICIFFFCIIFTFTVFAAENIQQNNTTPSSIDNASPTHAEDKIGGGSGDDADTMNDPDPEADEAPATSGMPNS